MIEINENIAKQPPSVQATTKFNADGTARRYRGNTVVSAVEPGTPLFAAAEEILVSLGTSPAGRRYALLPTSSLHMTVVQLLSEEYRRHAWSSKLSADCSLEEADDFMVKTLARITPPPPPAGCYTGGSKPVRAACA